MNSVLKWGLIIGASAYAIPKLLDLAADNPDKLRAAAKKAREARERGIEAAKEGARRGVAFAKKKAGLKGLGGLVRPPKSHPGKEERKREEKLFDLVPKRYRACDISPSALRRGIVAETKEHRDVTRGSVKQAAKIAAAHLCEDPNAY